MCHAHQALPLKKVYKKEKDSKFTCRKTILIAVLLTQLNKIFSTYFQRQLYESLDWKGKVMP